MTPDPTPPTPALDRAELRRMCEAASPGPWRACWYGPNEPAMLERVRIESPEDEGALSGSHHAALIQARKDRDAAQATAEEAHRALFAATLGAGKEAAA